MGHGAQTVVVAPVVLVDLVLKTSVVVVVAGVVWTLEGPPRKKHKLSLLQ